MSWTLDLIPLTKAIAESPVAAALNRAERMSRDAELLRKLGGISPAFQKLTDQMKFLDEKGNVSASSILGGLRGTVGATKMIADEAAKGLGKLEKVPVIGAVAAGLEAPLKEVSSILGSVEEVGKEVSNFAEKGNPKPADTNFAEKGTKVSAGPPEKP